jgi:hypothetical protein
MLPWGGETERCPGRRCRTQGRKLFGVRGGALEAQGTRIARHVYQRLLLQLTSSCRGGDAGASGRHSMKNSYFHNGHLFLVLARPPTVALSVAPLL